MRTVSESSCTWRWAYFSMNVGCELATQSSSRLCTSGGFANNPRPLSNILRMENTQFKIILASMCFVDLPCSSAAQGSTGRMPLQTYNLICEDTPYSSIKFPEWSRSGSYDLTPVLTLNIRCNYGVLMSYFVDILDVTRGRLQKRIQLYQ